MVRMLQALPDNLIHPKYLKGLSAEQIVLTKHKCGKAALPGFGDNIVLASSPGGVSSIFQPGYGAGAAGGGAAHTKKDGDKRGDKFDGAMFKGMFSGTKKKAVKESDRTPVKKPAASSCSTRKAEPETADIRMGHEHEQDEQMTPSFADWQTAARYLAASDPSLTFREIYERLGSGTLLSDKEQFSTVSVKAVKHYLVREKKKTELKVGSNREPGGARPTVPGVHVSAAYEQAQFMILHPTRNDMKDILHACIVLDETELFRTVLLQWGMMESFAPALVKRESSIKDRLVECVELARDFENKVALDSLIEMAGPGGRLEGGAHDRVLQVEARAHTTLKMKQSTMARRRQIMAAKSWPSGTEEYFRGIFHLCKGLHVFEGMMWDKECRYDVSENADQEQRENLEQAFAWFMGCIQKQKMKGVGRDALTRLLSVIGALQLSEKIEKNLRVLRKQCEQYLGRDLADFSEVEEAGGLREEDIMANTVDADEHHRGGSYDARSGRSSSTTNIPIPKSNISSANASGWSAFQEPCHNFYEMNDHGDDDDEEKDIRAESALEVRELYATVLLEMGVMYKKSYRFVAAAQMMTEAETVVKQLQKKENRGGGTTKAAVGAEDDVDHDSEYLFLSGRVDFELAQVEIELRNYPKAMRHLQRVERMRSCDQTLCVRGTASDVPIAYPAEAQVEGAVGRALTLLRVRILTEWGRVRDAMAQVSKLKNIEIKMSYMTVPAANDFPQEGLGLIGTFVALHDEKTTLSKLDLDARITNVLHKPQSFQFFEEYRLEALGVDARRTGKFEKAIECFETLLALKGWSHICVWNVLRATLHHAGPAAASAKLSEFRRRFSYEMRMHECMTLLLLESELTYCSVDSEDGVLDRIAKLLRHGEGDVVRAQALLQVVKQARDFVQAGSYVTAAAILHRVPACLRLSEGEVLAAFLKRFTGRGILAHLASNNGLGASQAQQESAAPPLAADDEFLSPEEDSGDEQDAAGDDDGSATSFAAQLLLLDLYGPDSDWADDWLAQATKEQIEQHYLPIYKKHLLETISESRPSLDLHGRMVAQQGGSAAASDKLPTTWRIPPVADTTSGKSRYFAAFGEKVRDLNTLDAYKRAIAEKGFAAAGKKTNGVKYDAPLIKVKLNTDRRLYATTIYENPERKKLILFEDETNHAGIVRKKITERRKHFHLEKVES
eukprot:g9713.t1